MREERERLGLSQSGFAEMGGVRRHSQINYEGDKFSPTADYLTAIAKMGVDVTYLLTGVRSASNNTEINPREAALLDNFRHAAPADQDAVLRLLNSVAQPTEADVTKSKKRA